MGQIEAGLHGAPVKVRQSEGMLYHPCQGQGGGHMVRTPDLTVG